MNAEIIHIPIPTPFPVGPVNVFLIKSDPPILIDTGPNTDEAYERLLTRLNEAEVGLSDLGHILLTHGHLDHAGLLPRIQHETRAQICAHPYVADQYANFDQRHRENWEFFRQIMPTVGAPPEVIEIITQYRQGVKNLGGNAQVNHPLKDGEVIGGPKAIFVPGHSPGDVIYYDSAQKIAFTGDHIIKKMSPNPLLRPRPDTTKPLLLQYRESLLTTQQLDIQTCYPGHGGSYHNHGEIIDDIMHRYDERLRQVLDLLNDTPATPYELMLKIFPNLTPAMLQFGVSLVMGNLRLLVLNGQAREEEVNGVMFYSQVAA